MEAIGIESVLQSGPKTASEVARAITASGAPVTPLQVWDGLKSLRRSGRVLLSTNAAGNVVWTLVIR